MDSAIVLCCSMRITIHCSYGMATVTTFYHFCYCTDDFSWTVLYCCIRLITESIVHLLLVSASLLNTAETKEDTDEICNYRKD